MTETTEHRPRVLLVDDEPSVTRGLKVGMRRKKWEIETAASGPEALALMDHEPFDVIVSDERMPGQSGSELLSLVRQQYPSTIRIILSGQASMEAAVKAINSAEIYRFLIKPCSPMEVAATIEEALLKRAEKIDFERWRESSLERNTDELSSSFDRALGLLYPCFQPILNADDRSVFAYEALCRSTEPGISTPVEIINTATLLDRYQEFGRAVRDAVALRIPDAPRDCSIFVNVDGQELADNRLTRSDEPLAPFAARVIVEITERESLEGSGDLAPRLKALRELGYGIAVDDLGAGYSGLNSFALLAPDVVKFDMEMIRNVDKSPTKASIVGSMTRLCHDLDIRTVAEGIETQAELDKVVELGCDLLQGFYLGRPERDFLPPAQEAA